MRLDEEGSEHLLAVTLEYVKRVEQIESAATHRLEDNAHDQVPSEATVVVMNFEGARLSETAPRP